MVGVGLRKPDPIWYEANNPVLSTLEYNSRKKWCKETLHFKWETQYDRITSQPLGDGSNFKGMEVQIQALIREQITMSNFYFENEQERNLYVLTFKGVNGK